MNTLACIAALATCLPAFATAGPAGMRMLSIEAPHHGREMSGTLMYPAKGETPAATFGENPVFYGTTVAPDAPMAEGRYPLVVLSHGLGGTSRSLAWLGAALAEQGAIVVTLNHPNSTWGDFDFQAAAEHWTRTQDQSLAIDTMLADPEFAAMIDENRIMSAGFSLGGWTALSMGGVTGALDAYREHCEQDGALSSHCQDIARAGLDLGKYDADDWDANHADPRITHVVAIDPAFIWGLSEDNLASSNQNITLIGLGEGADRHLSTDFDASGFARLFDPAAIVRIAPAAHFSLLPLCKPMGPAILEEENDDPVCTDPDGTDRAAVHQAVIARIAADLGL